jgi:hypothetical protein
MTASSTSNTTYLQKADDCLGLLGVVEIGSPMFYAIDFPELQYGQFAVCGMEISDGIPLFPDGQSHLDNEDGLNCWQVADSYEEAHQLAVEKIIADPMLECVIYSSDGRQVQTIRNGQPVPLEKLLASRSKKPKAWWQFWKEC